ncbi:2',3'-cyclic-nucleotide 3'-phosphodiesterase [Ambystoma mexicanum]|uniref:2',3'-cyclic-nucleotide 3'-phosphodiesterase n=1 Tax=Ambystoma mexicanum TaxID=8296 RepID=UPI0037E8EA94
MLLTPSGLLLGKRGITRKIQSTFSTILSSKMSSPATKDQAESQNFPFLMDEQTVATLKESKTLIILRGLPGSGKSYLAKEIQDKYRDSTRIISADKHNIKPVIRTVISKEYDDLDKALIGSFKKRSVNVIVLDDTHHDRERLESVFDTADAHNFTVILVEPKTQWRRDCNVLKDKSHWKLSMEELKGLRGPLEMEVLPFYFGWFLTTASMDTLKKLRHSFLDTLGGLKVFRKRATPFYVRDENHKGKVDLLSYFGQKPNIMHCTTKYCNHGTEPGSKEYSQLDAVKKSYGKVFTLSITALFITPETAGARVELDEQQLLLWPLDAEKEVMPSDNLPKGSRAHITLGCAKDVKDVQTGIDLLKFVQLQGKGEKGEEMGEICGGDLRYFNNGLWMLSLARKIEIKALFSGFYGKSSSTCERRKESSPLLSCTIA